MVSRTKRSIPRLAVTSCMVILVASAISACSRNDGRELRPPTGAQTDTVRQSSTSAAQVDDGRPALTLTAPWGGGEPDTGAPFDPRYTCDGLDVSPPLAWSGGPAETASYAIVLTDLDAVEYTHWVVANIPATQASLPEDYTDPLAVMAENSRGKAAYAGPCPPKGSSHQYVFTLYALSQVLEAQVGDPASALISAIEGATLETATLYATFGR